MREALPWLPRLLCGRADLAAFDAGEKQARQARLAGMAFAVHRAEIEELIAERVALFMLREDVLEREGEIAETSGFGPGAIVLFVFNERDVREEAATPVRAFFEAGLKLVGEDAAQCVELIGFDCVVGVHKSSARENRWWWNRG
jgi:hypothetical protein